MKYSRYRHTAMPEIPRLKAEFFKALSHPLRIRVLELLVDGHRTVSELQDALAVEQSSLSQQLGVLRRAGFVGSRREGSRVTYALADDRAGELLALSRQMLLDQYTASRDELERA
jgi:DNA-binding transcriptional ArsR family regulator